MRWKNSAKAELTLKRLSEARHARADGTGYYFDSQAVEFNEPILETMLEFPESVLRDHWPRIVWKGLQANGELNSKTFLDAARRAVSSYNASPYSPYYVLTTISISAELLPRRMAKNEANFYFLKGDFPKKYSSRAEVLSANDVKVLEAPSDYCRVVIKVIAKSPDKAIAQALKSLDLLRAAWNLMYNPVGASTWDTELKPVNVIRLGSYHTVHRSNGSAADPKLWYDPSYTPAPLFTGAPPATFLNNTQSWLDAIERSSYKGTIIDVLLLAVRSLDEPDPNVAFLKLWTAVEHLASNGTADHDAVIRRCAFLFSDVEHPTDVLSHLKRYRNASVHEGSQSIYARRETFFLLRYFNALVKFHLGRPGFDSVARANEFLDLPADIVELKRRKALLEQAIKFRSGKST
jgi:hypothetical protein